MPIVGRSQHLSCTVVHRGQVLHAPSPAFADYEAKFSHLCPMGSVAPSCRTVWIELGRVFGDCHVL